MSSSPRRIPKYRHYKPKNLGVVRLDGRDVYLGKHNSPESLENYHRLIAEWLAGGYVPPGRHGDPPAATLLTVNALMLAYMEFALTYYRRDGVPSREVDGIRDSLRPLRELYGRSVAKEFGPLRLKAVRKHMIDVLDLCRTEINKRIGRIKRVFRWAVSEELIPADVYHALQAVAGLQRGRTTARESKPVMPVPDKDVAALLPFLTPQVATMVRLQRLTGMRPGEVVKMKLCDIDMLGNVWTYHVKHHKTDWRGYQRTVALGPQSQQLLKPFLDRSPDSFLFSPRESLAWQRQRHQISFKKDRTTPIYPSELRSRQNAALARRRRKPAIRVGEHYTTQSYCRAVKYGLKKAAASGQSIPAWHPSRLRHSRATELRRLYGIEGSRVSLGHASLQATECYAERDYLLAVKIAQEVG